jgi:3-dehydroquinate synthase
VIHARTLAVELGDRGYDVVVGEGLLHHAGAAVAQRLGRRRIIVVTDENLALTRHPEVLRSSLRISGHTVDTIVVPAGEGTKAWPGITRVVERLLDLAVDRRTAVLALGGGVIGDLAGFAAAITLRGLDLIQAPTSLLAQVDSSVGGKTGINTTHGKNLVGAFHQPRLVLADTAVLDDLPPRELQAGYAELVKHALIRDAALFDWLEMHGRAVLDGDPALRVEAVTRSVAIKAAIVKEDERETSDLRALLNFGHTFAHAFESLNSYSGRLLHGEAVSLGMVKALRLSHAIGSCAGQDVERAIRHFERMGLPISVTERVPAGFRPDAVLQAMRSDKKAEAARLRFVLARRIGEAFVTGEVPEEVVREVLAAPG